MNIGARKESENTNGTKRRILVFVSLAYALSVALSLLIGLTGGHASRFVGLGYLSMLIPAVSVLATKAMVQNARRIAGWNRIPLRYFPVALFLMPIVLHMAMLPAASALDRLHWQGWLTPGADGLYHTPAQRGWGVLTPAGLGARMALNALAGLTVVSILALCEEIGWRGWLLPHLMERTGKREAVVICSMIWTIWHLPYILSGILYVEGVPLGWTTLIAPLGIFGSGLVIGWLWLRTKSIWIVAASHGALNNWGQYAFKFMSGEGQPRDGLVLASGSLALIAVGAALLFLEK